MTEPIPLEINPRDEFQSQLIADWLEDNRDPEVVEIANYNPFFQVHISRKQPKVAESVNSIQFYASATYEKDNKISLIGLPVVTNYQEPFMGAKTPPRATVDLPLVEMKDGRLRKVLVEKFQGAVPVVRELLKEFKNVIQQDSEAVYEFILKAQNDGFLESVELTEENARQYLAEYAESFQEKETE